MSTKKYRVALAEAMANGMSQKEDMMIIGQGVCDHKGLFGTTMGLKDKYPKRVIETPLAEDSIAGICIGAALNGMYPVNTHIRADFALLIFNQLVNLAAKYKYMFGGNFNIPMMMRLVIGRSWGQGAQHSQSIQSLLAHIPGLVVVMPSSSKTIEWSYYEAINKYKGPVVMLEHRLLYEIEFDDEEEITKVGLTGSSIVRKGKDITIIATSIMVLEAKRAAKTLSRHNIEVEVIDLHCISHPDVQLIVESAMKTKRVLIADTSWVKFGVCSEMTRLIIENCNKNDIKIETLGMKEAPCPTAKALEDMYYPEQTDIIEKATRLYYGDKDHSIQIPKRESMCDYYKHFKGPF